MIKEKFYKNIKEHNMFSETDSVVVAVSGGADSVCLFSLLLSVRTQLKITINCAHINHNLRKTAKRDEDFVRSMCEKNNVPFFLYSADIAKIAKTTGESEESTGRTQRYKFFFEVAKETHSRIILTAHNKEDSAETVLMHLMRGSGSHGLRGIAPVREDGVGRPLIDISRKEIEEYLKFNNIPYIEDETNKEDKYKRNFVRLNILPLMREYNPSVTDAIMRAAKAVTADDDFILELSEKAGGVTVDGEKVIITAKSLNDNPPPIAIRILLKALKIAGIKPSQNDIEAIFALSKSQTGKKHVFPCNKTAYKSYDKIIIETPAEKKDYSYNLEPEKEIYIREIGKNILITCHKPQGSHIIIKYCDGKYEVRSRRDGDRFSPCNMIGTKKVKDYFIDEKIPQHERWKIPVITCNGHIAVVGERVDNSFIASDNNRTLFIIIR